MLRCFAESRARPILLRLLAHGLLLFLKLPVALSGGTGRFPGCNYRPQSLSRLRCPVGYPLPGMTRIAEAVAAHRGNVLVETKNLHSRVWPSAADRLW